MHKLLFTFFCLSIFLSKSQPETVLNNMLEQEQAWNKGDIKKFMQHYWQSDSLTFIGSKGVTKGWQKTLDNYLKSYPSKESMGQLTFTIIETRVLSVESIYVIGKWELKKEKPASGHFTLLWKKINNAWVIVSDHTS
jgi:ketosteroid isomerase-like protein